MNYGYDPRAPMRDPREEAMSLARRQFATAKNTRELRIKATDMLTRTTEKWDADDLTAAVEKLIAYWNRAEALGLDIVEPKP